MLPLSVVTTDFDWSEDEDEVEDEVEDEYAELTVDALLSRAVPSRHVEPEGD